MTTREDILSLAEIEARAECARRGIDPDEICADGGVTAWMVVEQETRHFSAAPTPPVAKAWHDSLALDTAREVIREYGYHHNGGDGHKLAAIQCIIGRSLAKAIPPAAEAPGQEPVAVKPLEWIDHTKGEGCPQRRLARLPFGRLVIFQFGSDDGWYVGWDGPDGKFVGSTEAEAKAAAQADYEQRIRSALVSAPPTYADAEAKGFERGREAAARWHEEEALLYLQSGEKQLANAHHRHAVAIRSLVSPAPKGETLPNYIKCDDCNGTGLALDMSGEPGICRECRGNTVVQEPAP